MSVELSSASTANSAKPVAGPNHWAGKAAGKSDAADDAGAGGFSALMGQLSASEPASDPLASDGLTTPAGDVAVDAIGTFIPNAPLAQAPYVQAAIDLVATKSQPSNAIDAAGVDLALLAGVGNAGAVGDLADKFIPNMPLAQASYAQEATNLIAKSSLASGVTQGTKNAGLLDASKLAAGSADQMTAGQTAADAKAQSQVDALLGHRSAVQSQTLSTVQLSLREVKPVLVAMPQTAPPDAASLLAAAGASELLLRPTERSSGKSAIGASGGGFDALFGQATAATGQTATVYEIAAPSATVPESGVAETVSYWVTHGVQSAELTLDGFGADPVEVRISLNGDQAQIDFRTDQADVRQLLAGAATQLKELLSGEGLQLAGVSVGDSGKGNTPGDDQPPRPGTKRVAQVAAPVMMPTVSSRANLAVGQSLDMFV